MFNLAEKERAISEAVEFSEFVKERLPNMNTDELPLFFKALANYVEKTSTKNSVSLLQEVQQLLAEGNLQRAVQRIFIHMVTVGTSEDVLEVRMYSTGDVARFFGVSVATINNWINQEKLLGVEKVAKFKQARIPESAIYIAPTGERTTIKEVAAMYEAEQDRFNRQKPMTPAEELAEMVSAVVHYEKKYRGEYKDTLAKKDKLTPVEERDAHEWLQLLHSIEVHRA